MGCAWATHPAPTRVFDAKSPALTPHGMTDQAVPLLTSPFRTLPWALAADAAPTGGAEEER